MFHKTTVFIFLEMFNPLSANPIKWSNSHKQFVGNLLTNCLSVFNRFVKLALKGLSSQNERVISIKT